MGYVFHPDGKLDSVSWSSFELYEHGEDGNPPKEFNAKFTAGREFVCASTPSPIILENLPVIMK